MFAFHGGRSRVFASSTSSCGVVCDSLMNPWSKAIRPSPLVKMTRAMRRCRRERTSHKPRRACERAAFQAAAELHGLDVLAKDAVFLARLGLEPFAHRLVARSSAEEGDGANWRLAVHQQLNSWSIFCFTAASILMSGGQGRLKPSPGIFFVASRPSLLPLAISLVAWSGTPDGPLVSPCGRPPGCRVAGRCWRRGGRARRWCHARPRRRPPPRGIW